MKKYINNIAIVLLSFVAISLSSCDKDDDTVAAPTITLEEANLEGEFICVEAEIEAPGRIDVITITVSSADNTKTKLTTTFVESKYANLLNTEFHEHITDIEGVQEGDILTLVVTDKNGNTATVQKNITQEEEEEE